VEQVNIGYMNAVQLKLDYYVNKVLVRQQKL